MKYPPQDADRVKNILIAEDSATQAEQLRQMLVSHGYNVSVAQNGKLALEAIRKERPTLVVSDVMMPEMDGYDLCRTIKSEPDLKDIPVMLLTSLSDPADIIRGLLCAANNFIVKPYREDELLSRIEYILVNRELRQLEKSQLGVDIYFAGQRHLITSDRLQILDLLFSTYETAVQKNHELLDAQEELQKLNKELEAFSYSVSHDLRTPVRQILGFTSLMAPLIPPGGKEQEYLATIQNAGTRMMTMIESLLTFSRLTHADLRKDLVDMNGIVSEASTNLRIDTEGRTVEWTISRLPQVHGDRVLLYEVFQNLLGNAIKYTRPRPVARIEVGHKEGSKSDDVFFVRDNGVGFDMKYVDRLFGIFQRLHSESEFGGTGIGLANVRRIITRHGGNTWAEAKVNEGATFYFSLPRTKPEST
ncbi:MAG TPA: response regulator [Bacteroidota bacterium]